MEYKVVPFYPVINREKDNTKKVAKQLEDIIENFSNQGWKYIRLESVETHISPIPGCFGFGSKPGFKAYRRMIVFSKE
ncbi:hypothetical protein WH52_00315 [Tenacibaculum holothuriorum]|uniref:DUF4177 domain-containing protein n=1 Tax=Tenacibaculum holothuriorum TaxID=1635173 RepID=A0A1Y2PH69_9FLAO|nr:hypothetical protein [Tenacibaculum holothuriorum]OSY89137.1 hypothetical protein WH52_00315 [Tenacibaculum holothuriorum]